MCAETCGNQVFVIEMKRENKINKLPKVRVKVSKKAFDRVLGKLIKTQPVKRGEQGQS
jgi:hypothetical protein